MISMGICVYLRPSERIQKVEELSARSFSLARDFPDDGSARYALRDHDSNYCKLKKRELQRF